MGLSESLADPHRGRMPHSHADEGQQLSTTYVEVTRRRRSRPSLAAAASLPGGGPVFVDTGAFADAAGAGKSFIIANPGRARYAAPMARTKPATIDRFGRILIPKALREGAGLRAGTEVEIVAEGRALRLLPRDEGVLLREVGGVLVASGEAVGDLVGAVRRDRQKRLDKVASRRR